MFYGYDVRVRRAHIGSRFAAMARSSAVGSARRASVVVGRRRSSVVGRRSSRTMSSPPPAAPPSARAGSRRSDVARRVRAASVAIAATLALASARAVTGVKIDVKPAGTECVRERTKERGVTVSGSWFAAKAARPAHDGSGHGDWDDYSYWDRAEGGTFDMRVNVLRDANAPTDTANGALGDEIYNALAETEHRFEYTVREVGVVETCFKNNGRKTASVNYHAQSGHKWDHGKASAENIDPAYEQLNNVESRVGRLMEEVRYHKTRTRRHMRTAKTVNKRVFRWAFLEAATMIAASYYQFVYVKRLFDRRERRGAFAV